jgi:hypothetical protein
MDLDAAVAPSLGDVDQPGWLIGFDDMFAVESDQRQVSCLPHAACLVAV